MSNVDLDSFFKSMIDHNKEKETEKFFKKVKEYKEHFGESFAYDNPFLNMSDEEIIENIDKCIKYNREWVGFIVPEEDFSDPNIMY